MIESLPGWREIMEQDPYKITIGPLPREELEYLIKLFPYTETIWVNTTYA
jgi:hypothetical protein